MQRWTVPYMIDVDWPSIYTAAAPPCQQGGQKGVCREAAQTNMAPTPIVQELHRGGGWQDATAGLLGGAFKSTYKPADVELRPGKLSQ